MKKNKIMRLASALLVLTLLSTSIISGTFAKYTTSGKATDTARVAKWGVVVETSGTLYSDAYTIENSGASAWSYNYQNDNITVASATATDNVVAPGTACAYQGLGFSVSGTPEVATKITATISARDIYLASGYDYAIMIPETKMSVDNIDKIAGFEGESGTSSKIYYYDKTAGTFTPISKKTEEGVINYYAGDTKLNVATAFESLYLISDQVATMANDYCPVIYKLGNGTADSYAYNTGTVSTKDAVAIGRVVANKLGTVETSVEEGVTTYTVSAKNATVFDALTNLATAGPKLGDLHLTWEWAFENGKDNADTLLGNMITAYANANKKATLAEEYIVVAKTSTNTVYTQVNYDDNYQAYLNVVTTEEKDGRSTQKTEKVVVASLQTKFDIELTVTQVD